MKRLFIAALAVSITTTTFASFAATTPGTSVTAVREEREKTPVKLEDLPASVTKALQSPDFEGWKPVTAWWVKTEKSSFYEIELSRGDEKKTVNLTAEGARVL